MFNIDQLIRDNIKALKPYSSAREEYTGKEALFLDANENPFNNPYNRYPDPLQLELKYKLANLKGIIHNQLFLGNGSDEAIDLLFRAFCEPGKDNVIIPDPTYGMYRVCADINNTEVRNVSLQEDFQIDLALIKKRINKNTKLIFLCSPNNPTSNSFDRQKMIELINHFQTGLVVIDEAYIDFSMQKSLVEQISEFKNLVILQTMSKAWGLAGIRLGMAIADKKIISVLNKIKYPYNVNSLSQQKALEAISSASDKIYWVQQILSQRKMMEEELYKLRFVKHIYPSDANFLLIKVKNPLALYNYLVKQKIIVRDRSNVHLCEGCLRFTVGSKKENKRLIEVLFEYDEIFEID